MREAENLFPRLNNNWIELASRVYSMLYTMGSTFNLIDCIISELGDTSYELRDSICEILYVLYKLSALIQDTVYELRDTRYKMTPRSYKCSTNSWFSGASYVFCDTSLENFTLEARQIYL
jgi:hypothetical protein